MPAFRTFAAMKKILMLAVIAIGLVACRSKDPIDVKAPVIEAFTIDGVATSAVTKDAGQTISVSVSFSDNETLNQVQINVHAASNGHSHDGNGHAGGEDRMNSGSWIVSEVINLSGESASHVWDLHIPDSVAGNWHILISALDDLGNVAITYNALLTVTNANLPIITANTNPLSDTTGTVYISAGSGFQISGQATDANGLSRMFVHLDSNTGISGDTLEIPISGDGHTMAFGPASFNNSVLGAYRIVVEAIDSLGYKKIWDAKVVAQ